jgi:hypothetical protein
MTMTQCWHDLSLRAAPRVFPRAAVAAAGLVLLLAGCGGPAPSPSATAPPATTPPATAQPAPSATPPAPTPPSSPGPTKGAIVIDASLKIVMSTQGVTGSQELVLECVDSKPTARSTVSNPDAACAALAKSGDVVFFAPPNPNRACTQQYGGPQQARVTGTLNGKPVDKVFSLTDGCRIAEWQAMQPLFGDFGPGV